jgi:hypothetical protein
MTEPTTDDPTAGGDSGRQPGELNLAVDVGRARPAPKLRRLLDVTNLDPVLEVYPTVEAAAAA